MIIKKTYGHLHIPLRRDAPVPPCLRPLCLGLLLIATAVAAAAAALPPLLPPL